MVTEIRSYAPERIDECVGVLAAAFASNPLHCSLFGPEPLAQNRAFFRIALLRMFAGQRWIALRDDAVCGYLHFNPSPHCLPLPEEIPSAVAALFPPLEEFSPRLIHWLTRWCRLDPDEPHLHLGPVAVAPGAQRQGVGTALMRRYIEQLEAQKMAGYLETDRPENVVFYERFGFRVRHSEALIGVRTWYMWRP